MNLTAEEDEFVHRITKMLYASYKKSFDKAHMDRDDVLSSGYMGWIRAQQTHDPEKAPLEFWILRNIQWSVLRELDNNLNFHSHHAFTSDIEDVCPSSDYEYLDEEHVDVRKLVYDLSFSDDDVSILFLRLYGKMSFEQLEEVTGFSRTTLWRRINLAKSKIKNQLI